MNINSLCFFLRSIQNYYSYFWTSEMMKYKIDLTLLTCVPLSDVNCWHMYVMIKGSLAWDFWHQVFFTNRFLPGPWYPVETILNFYKNLRRYSQLCVYCWCHWIDKILEQGLITGVNDNSDPRRCHSHWQLIIASVVDTGDSAIDLSQVKTASAIIYCQ